MVRPRRDGVALTAEATNAHRLELLDLRGRRDTDDFESRWNRLLGERRGWAIEPRLRDRDTALPGREVERLPCIADAAGNVGQCVRLDVGSERDAREVHERRSIERAPDGADAFRLQPERRQPRRVPGRDRVRAERDRILHAPEITQARRTTSSAVPNPGRDVSVNPPSMLTVRARMFFSPWPAAVD